jgi:hypothetical protein
MSNSKKVRIYSRGPAFQFTLTFGGLAFIIHLINEEIRYQSGQLQFLGWVVILGAAISAVQWLSQPRVLIDVNAGYIWFGRDRVPLSVFAGVEGEYTMLRHGRRRGVSHVYAVYLVRNDGCQPKLVALRSMEGASHRLQHEVARLLGLPVLRNAA